MVIFGISRFTVFTLKDLQNTFRYIWYINMKCRFWKVFFHQGLRDFYLKPLRTAISQIAWHLYNKMDFSILNVASKKSFGMAHIYTIQRKLKHQFIKNREWQKMYNPLLALQLLFLFCSNIGFSLSLALQVCSAVSSPSLKQQVWGQCGEIHRIHFDFLSPYIHQKQCVCFFYAWIFWWKLVKQL